MRSVVEAQDGDLAPVGAGGERDSATGLAVMALLARDVVAVLGADDAPAALAREMRDPGSMLGMLIGAFGDRERVARWAVGDDPIADGNALAT